MNSGMSNLTKIGRSVGADPANANVRNGSKADIRLNVMRARTAFIAGWETRLPAVMRCSVLEALRHDLKDPSA
jgi:hypothetical protein